MVEDKSSQGRLRKEYLFDILKDVGCTGYVVMKRIAEDRGTHGKDLHQYCGQPIVWVWPKRETVVQHWDGDNIYIY